MPLPFIIGGIAAAAAGTGLVSGALGAKKFKNANDIIKFAEEKYEENKTVFTHDEEETTYSLEVLGKEKYRLIEESKRFTEAFAKIKNRPTFEERTTKNLKLPEHGIKDIEKFQVSSLELLSAITAMGGAGSFAGFAAYGGVMAFGTASTGATISGLSGAAATKATMAALGGGSLAAGGGGMALGSVILTAGVAGPVIGVSGLLINHKASKSMEKANEVVTEVDNIIEIMNHSSKFLRRLKELSKELEREIRLTKSIFNKELTRFEDLVGRENNYNKYNDNDKKLVDINIKLMHIAYRLFSQDLLEEKSENEIKAEIGVEKNLTQKLLENETKDLVDTASLLRNEL